MYKFVIRDLRKPLLFGVLSLSVLSFNGSANAQNKISIDEVNTIIENMVKLIDERFIDIPAGKAVIEGINKNLRSGKYRSITNDRDFVTALNKDLYALSKDLHLVVQPMRKGIQCPGISKTTGKSGEGEFKPEPCRVVGQHFFKRPANGHFSSKILHGNIGYVKVNGVLAPLKDSKVREDMEAALLFVKNTDAVIFDLRNVPGGFPETISLLSSYLYDDEPNLQNTYHNRISGSSTLYTRPDEVPFHFGLNRPIYILINRGTGSAAEAFTYHNQQHGRATVIGENSIGAGRLSEIYAISKTLYMMVPENRSEHPVSKKGFEQVGVKPNVDVKGEDSLPVAHATALKTLIKNNPENSKWRSALPKIARDRQKISDKLGEYVGIYGERSILISGTGLAYKRAGQPELELQKIGKDTYKIVLPSGARSRGPIPTVRFDRDENGKIKSISLVLPDGREVGTYAKQAKTQEERR